MGMSARNVIAGTMMAYSSHSVGELTADAILAALHAAGYVVAKVPDIRHTTTPVDGYNAGWNACLATIIASSEETS